MTYKLPEGWRKTKLSSISETNKSNYNKKDNWESVNYLETGNIKDGIIDKINLIDLKVDKLPSRAKRKVSQNDIVYSSVRPVQKHLGIIKDPENNMLVSTGFIVITAKKKELNPFYLYFYLNQNSVTQHLQSIAEQRVSTYPALNVSDLKTLFINLPPLPEQKAIADTLSSLDDKIELNNKINENLENQAQAIFKNWFVDFEFPDENGNPYKSSGGEMVESELGMIPKGWEVKSIKDYANVKSGFAFKSEWWLDKGVKVLKIANISSGKLNLDNCSYVDKQRIPEDKRYIAYPTDLLIALTGATLGKMSIVPKIEETLLVNQRVGKFIYRNKFEYPLPFLYCLLNTKSISKVIVDRGMGSAQPNISPNGLGSIKIMMPTNRLINNFNELLKPNFEYYIHSYNQNLKLSELRNTLLPKLMSGELRIPINSKPEN